MLQNMEIKQGGSIGMNHADQVLGVRHVLWSQKLDEVHVGKPRINENKFKYHRGDKVGEVTLPVC